MRITKVHITHYGPIVDSGEVTLEPKITTLVGKNETGKTCFLRALDSFRPDYGYVLEDLSLHSGLREKIEKKEIDGSQAEMLTLWFAVEPEDHSRLQEIAPRLEGIETLTVTKRFDGSYHIESPELSLNESEIPHKEEIEDHFSHIHDAAKAFEERLDTHAERHAPFLDSKADYTEIIETIMAYVSDPKPDPDIDTVFQEFSTRLRGLPHRDETIEAEIEAFISEIEVHKDEIKRLFVSREGIKERIVKILPNFMYCTDIERLEDTVPIAEFLAHKHNHKTLSKLIELVGLDVEGVKDAGDYEMLSALHSASTTISGAVNESWTQERVTVTINIVRDNLVVALSDSTLTRAHPPSIRSQGFQWFLAFYLTFGAGSQGEFKDTILLLDDLGMHLHRSGQRDLLKTLERLSDENQIVFSTHSPFMVDKGKPERVRVVSKREGEGTRLTQPPPGNELESSQRTPEKPHESTLT